MAVLVHLAITLPGMTDAKGVTATVETVGSVTVGIDATADGVDRLDARIVMRTRTLRAEATETANVKIDMGVPVVNEGTGSGTGTGALEGSHAAMMAARLVGTVTRMPMTVVEVTTAGIAVVEIATRISLRKIAGVVALHPPRRESRLPISPMLYLSSKESAG
jgi:hypothetical protein